MEMQAFSNSQLKKSDISIGLRPRQNMDSCTFGIIVDSTTVYTIDLSTVTANTPVPFNTTNFTPQSNSTTIYQEVCPPDVPFPVLKVANLVLVTGPAPPASATLSDSTSVGIV